MAGRGATDPDEPQRFVVAKPRGRRTAHFFALDQPDGAVRRSLCGRTFATSELDAVSRLNGALPCELCVRDVPVEPSATDPAGAVPADDEHSSETYGAGLRGEFVWHRLPESPPVHFYEGREVVVATCGAVAFLVFGTPPEQYQRCPKCPEYADCPDRAECPEPHDVPAVEPRPARCRPPGGGPRLVDQ